MSKLNVDKVKLSMSSEASQSNNTASDITTYKEGEIGLEVAKKNEAQKNNTNFNHMDIKYYSKLWSKFSKFLIALMLVNFIFLIIFEDSIFNSKYFIEYMVLGLSITFLGFISIIMHIYFTRKFGESERKTNVVSKINRNKSPKSTSLNFKSMFYNIYLYSYSIVIIVFLTYLTIYETFLKSKSDIYLYLLILFFGVLIGYSFAYKSFKYFEKLTEKNNEHPDS